MIDGESVQEFYEKVLSHSEGLKVSDEIIMGCLLNGLPDYIQSYVNLRQPTDLFGALLIAKQGEIVAQFEARKGDFITQNGSKGTPSQFIQNQENSQNFCQFCQRIGHKKSTCRAAKRHLRCQLQHMKQKINKQAPRSEETDHRSSNQHKHSKHSKSPHPVTQAQDDSKHFGLLKKEASTQIDKDCLNSVRNESITATFSNQPQCIASPHQPQEKFSF